MHDPEKALATRIGPARELILVATVCMAQLLTQAGVLGTIAILQAIGGSFGTRDQPGILSWYIASYSLTVGTFILPAGRAGDVFGHRKVFIAGFAWFGLWSLVCGFAYYSRSSSFFIFCRVMQGIGPAAVMPCGVAILGRSYVPGVRKAIAFSAMGATAPTGAVLGALFASLITRTQIWALAYWIYGITCFACAALAWVLPRELDDNDVGRPQSYLSALDIPAASAGVAGLVLLNIAWNQAPIDSWASASVLVCLLLGIAFILLFVYLELRVASHPLITSDMFNTETALILGCVSVGWGAFGIWIYYGWSFLELLRNQPPLLVTAQFVPVVLAGLAAGALTALLLQTIGAAYVMLFAMIAFMAANLLFSLASVQQSYWAITFVAIAIAPFGMDMSFPAANVVISDFVPRERQGAGASLVNTVINYSISIGLGVAGTTEVHLNKGGSDVLRGYRAAWRVGIGLGALGICMAALLIYKTRKPASSQN